MDLDKKELASIKSSFFNILALFLKQKQIESKYVVCLMKWSAQLNLSQDDLHKIAGEFNNLAFQSPEGKLERMEAIYHLVHMIYLDNIVEDIELEVATIYAKELGFKPSIVGELFKAIATAPFDGKMASVRSSVKDFMELYEVD
ncbi:MAG TPA: hypothetical protein PKL31_16690 [Fulvivirga sp.]|nr:hypothetical protein [Fulvivirga sp.]